MHDLISAQAMSSLFDRYIILYPYSPYSSRWPLGSDKMQVLGMAGPSEKLSLNQKHCSDSPRKHSLQNPRRGPD